MLIILILFASASQVFIPLTRSSCTSGFYERGSSEEYNPRFAPSRNWPPPAPPREYRYHDYDRRYNDYDRRRYPGRDRDEAPRRYGPKKNCKNSGPTNSMDDRKLNEYLDWMKRHTTVYNYRFEADQVPYSPSHEGGPPPVEAWKFPRLDSSLFPQLSINLNRNVTLSNNVTVEVPMSPTPSTDKDTGSATGSTKPPVRPNPEIGNLTSHVENNITGSGGTQQKVTANPQSEKVTGTGSKNVTGSGISASDNAVGTSNVIGKNVTTSEQVGRDEVTTPMETSTTGSGLIDNVVDISNTTGSENVTTAPTNTPEVVTNPQNVTSQVSNEETGTDATTSMTGSEVDDPTTEQNVTQEGVTESNEMGQDQNLGTGNVIFVNGNGTGIESQISKCTPGNSTSASESEETTESEMLETTTATPSTATTPIANGSVIEDQTVSVEEISTETAINGQVVGHGTCSCIIQPHDPKIKHAKNQITS